MDEQIPQIPTPLPELPSPSASASPGRDGHKPFAWKFFATLVIILLVAAVAYYAISNWSDQNSVVAVPSYTHDSTASWKTYTNSQYGFEFKYPSFANVEPLLYGTRI